MATTAPSVDDICLSARDAAHELAAIDGATRAAALRAMADALEARADEILAANERDMEAGRDEGLSASLMDRLALDPARLAGIASDVRTIAALPDPVGETLDGHRLPNGLDVQRVRVPLGVVAVVYEARPNVTIDCSALCIKSGNAIVLRGSSMAANSNAALAQVAASAIEEAGLPAGAIALVTGGDRDELRQLATQDGVVDLIIPRGGEGLKNALKQHATVPVMYAAAGNCHVYVDASADLDDALDIIVNAKVQRPSVCNAAETLLVHADVAPAFLPRALPALREAGVELRVDGRARAAAGPLADSLIDATEEDWSTEYHALILAVKVVDSVTEAVGPREPLRIGSLRGHRDRLDRLFAVLHHRGRRGLRLRQRLHALHRRRRVRHGRRDRQLHPEAPRPRPDRRARAHQLQVRRPRLRPDTGVADLRRGVFGGAFNPPHMGHLICAQEARWQLGLDRVTMMPMGRAPHRAIEPEPGPDVRVELCRLAVAGSDWLEVSELEVDRDGLSYTVDTLADMHEQAPADELSLILGADQAAHLASWREPERVLELARVAVAAREGMEREAVLRRLDDTGRAAAIDFFEMPRVDISSTLVRERAAEGRPLRYLVPDAVAEVVLERSLYAAAVERP